MKKKKVLVIVAHPDDETIWMGGTLIRNKDKWETAVISLCRAGDKDRAPKFKKVCEKLNAKSAIFDLEDEKLNPVEINAIINLLSDYLKEKYDYIFTHGESGEYGHIRHIETNKAITSLVKNKKIKTKKLFLFSYIKKTAKNTDTGFDCYANKKANKFINLNPLELLTKKDLIGNLYGFQKGGFEERSSGEIEAFTEYKK